MRINWKVLIVAGVFGAFTLVLLNNPPVAAEQSHMENALSSLQHAKKQLEKAKSNKGGHKSDAIKFIEKAMKEVREGMRYVERHKKSHKKFPRYQD